FLSDPTIETDPTFDISIWAIVVKQLDHKNLDFDVPYFKQCIRYVSYTNLGWA
ncbi:hypothetical protein GBAR_LOCUS18320, partial [Geodia barretti]